MVLCFIICISWKPKAWLFAKALDLAGGRRLVWGRGVWPRRYIGMVNWDILGICYCTCLWRLSPDLSLLCWLAMPAMRLRQQTLSQRLLCLLPPALPIALWAHQLTIHRFLWRRVQNLYESIAASSFLETHKSALIVTKSFCVANRVYKVWVYDLFVPFALLLWLELPCSDIMLIRRIVKVNSPVNVGKLHE